MRKLTVVALGSIPSYTQMAGLSAEAMSKRLRVSVESAGTEAVRGLVPVLI